VPVPDNITWRPPVLQYRAYRWVRFHNPPQRGKRGRWLYLGTVQATSESSARWEARLRFGWPSPTRVKAEEDNSHERIRL